jgi:hypothetical protein
MDDANGRGMAIAPCKMARQHILRTLVPLEADQWHGSKMGFPSGDERTVEGIHLSPRSGTGCLLSVLQLDTAPGIFHGNHASGGRNGDGF